MKRKKQDVICIIVSCNSNSRDNFYWFCPDEVYWNITFLLKLRITDKVCNMTLNVLKVKLIFAIYFLYRFTLYKYKLHKYAICGIQCHLNFNRSIRFLC